MWAVMKKELKSYFYSPIGYVFIGLFLAIFSFIFYITTISQGAVTYQYVFFYSVMYIVIFLIPLLTMRTFAEERKNGTEQILMTAPRSAVAIVLGKFLAALVAVSTIAIFVLAWLAPSISTKLTAISLIEKFYPFATGVFPITETISLISITAMFVALTMVVIKRRKLVK